MNLKYAFQSVIALHQEEMPWKLYDRLQTLPINTQQIVTVTGVRRCGKSSLLALTINRLLQKGVKREQIVYIGFDDERFSNMGLDNFDEILQAYREMHPTLALKEAYLFFDEIQLIKGWELFVLRVYKNYCKNIYITGSTAQMLSAEMSSALRGWPDEYKEYPLCFKEFLDFKGIKANAYTEQGAAILSKAVWEYLREGGFPQVVLAPNESDRTKLLQSYFNTMLFRDLIEHYNLSAAASTLRYFLKRVMNNLTKPTSINSIYNDIKSQGLKVSKDSLYLWLDYACNIFLFYKLPRYSQSIIKQNSAFAKYYVADFALLRANLLPQSDENGKALENAVFLKLLHEQCHNDQLFYFNEGVECDFVVVRQSKVVQLIQVCWELNAENELREFRGLEVAAQATQCNQAKVITHNQQYTRQQGNLNIDIVPAWNFLLN